MQVWNVLHAARWKYRIQKSPKIRHLGTIAQLYDDDDDDDDDNNNNNNNTKKYNANM